MAMEIQATSRSVPISCLLQSRRDARAARRRSLPRSAVSGTGPGDLSVELGPHRELVAKAFAAKSPSRHGDPGPAKTASVRRDSSEPSWPSMRLTRIGSSTAASATATAQTRSRTPPRRDIPPAVDAPAGVLFRHPDQRSGPNRREGRRLTTRAHTPRPGVLPAPPLTTVSTVSDLRPPRRIMR